MDKNTFNSPRVVTVAKPGMALMLLFSLFAFFLILTPILTSLIGRLNIKADALLRIAMIIQDVLVFILPALFAALLSTRLPARLLAVDTRPRMITLLLSLVTLLCSIPAMNVIIEWNQAITFPESMSGFEQMMRQLEDNAKAVTDSLMAGATVPSLIVSVLIVGVFAGFSEELFFRGAMQRIMMSTRLNVHVTIWVVAVIFSLFHFQFFGFMPRLLLGAYFGYLLVWSRSLWVPVLVHVFNNSLVVFSTWHSVNNPGNGVDIDNIGTDLSSASGILMLILSVVLTVACLIATRRSCKS